MKYPEIPVLWFECLHDVARASIVHATENAIKINFVQDMRDAGIAREVALFWWSKYILQEEQPEVDDPLAFRVRTSWEAVADSVVKGAMKPFQAKGGMVIPPRNRPKSRCWTSMST